MTSPQAKDDASDAVAPTTHVSPARLLTKLRARWGSIGPSLARRRAAARLTLRRLLPTESQHLFALTLVVGVVCGFAAVAFHLAIRAAERLIIDRALHAPGSSWMAWTVISPTLGGLLSGALLTYVVPGARGSGIPQVKQAFATEGGRVRFRDAFGKFWIAAFAIGSGASLGREGPTVHICAGAASMLARATALPPKNMRRLMPVGVAAGIAAAFNAPIAAVTFTIEEIVGTLDQTVLSGVVVAAALAAVIERGVLGVHPVIEVRENYGLNHSSSLLIYALLGVAAAVVSVAFTDGLLRLRKGFRASKVVPGWAQPGVGGLVTGVLAVAMLKLLGTTGVTGGGYETLGRALAGQLGIRVLLALCGVKLVATVFSYSSGGAGGIFAPSLFVGAMLGGAFGYLDVAAWHHEGRQLGAFALVGMGAVFAGVIRAPITSVLIIFEMTGGYGLVLPLMLANTTAYALARRWRPTPIYEALLEQDGVVLPRATGRPHVLDTLTVGEAMTADVVTAHDRLPASLALELVGERNFALLPVVDDEASIVGTVSVKSLRESAPATLLADLVRTAQTVRATEPLLRAVVRMNDLGVRQLLVTSSDRDNKLAGILAMSDVVRAHARAARQPAPEAMPSFAASTAPGLSVKTLISEAPIVSGRMNLHDLIPVLVGAKAKAAIVRGEHAELAVVLLEHVEDFANDEDLQKILIAEDVARPAPTLSERAAFLHFIRIFAPPGREAIIVLGDDQQPAGIVTRSAAGAALLEWYAAQDGTGS